MEVRKEKGTGDSSCRMLSIRNQHYFIVQEKGEFPALSYAQFPMRDWNTLVFLTAIIEPYILYGLWAMIASIPISYSLELWS